MANTRIELFEIRNVIVRMRLGDSDRQIAKAGLVSRTKAAKLREVATDSGWLNLENPLPSDPDLAKSFVKPPAPKTSSKIEPYSDQVEKWWKEGIQGKTIHRALRERFNFDGSYSAVRRFLQKLEQQNPTVTTVLDFAPGEAAQIDFGQGPLITDVKSGDKIKTHLFVMTLCWSRHQYLEIVPNQKIETWLGCHRRAFEFFGGVPAKVIIDNPKCAITKACYHDPEVQRSYSAFAEAYGFKIDACPPREPKKKGRVESGVKYAKNNFVPLREFRSLADGNRQARAWVMGEAGNRTHGTTQEKPLTRFVETEKHLLKPLPPMGMDITFWVKVKLHGNCHVQFEKCRYSAPFRLVNKELWLKVTEKTVEIYYEHELVATHPRFYKAGSRSTVDDHLPPNALAYKMRDPQWCLKQATKIGPCCLAVIEKLFAHRVLDNLNAAQGVISLGKRFGHKRLEAACKRAVSFDSVTYRSVKQILERGLDSEPVAEESFDNLASTYLGAGRFCRDTANLLIH